MIGAGLLTVIVHASQVLMEMNKGAEGQCLCFADEDLSYRRMRLDLPKVTQEVCDRLGDLGALGTGV